LYLNETHTKQIGAEAKKITSSTKLPTGKEDSKADLKKLGTKESIPKVTKKNETKQAVEKKDPSKPENKKDKFDYSQ
jgi:hypothetical protein